MNTVSASIAPITCHICLIEHDANNSAACIRCSKFTCDNCFQFLSIKSYLLKKDRICKDCYKMENNPKKFPPNNSIFY